MRDLFYQIVENLGRLVMEWAQGHRLVYVERLPACEVEETWTPPILRMVK